jgi:diadenosine tetraphosphate (Ap4A) HIT family hydrolase
MNTDKPSISMNDTLIKFGYPDSVIKSYQHWSVLLRPEQVTLGSLILASHSQANAFGDLSDLAMKELSAVTNDIEASLTDCFSFDKINYLMLMMVDPHVHFHVIPRYNSPRKFETIMIQDKNWPGPPDLSNKLPFNSSQKKDLLALIKAQWISH